MKKREDGMRLKAQEGFTVLEMIIVISVITTMIVLFFWYTQSTFLRGKSALIDNWVETLNTQVELYKIQAMEAGTVVNWKSTDEALAGLSRPIPRTDRVNLFENNLSENKYANCIWWDAKEQKFYRKD